MRAQQNLVLNGSFEEKSSCPSANDLGDGQFTRCNNWWYPTASTFGTSDYFCACNDTIGGGNQGVVGVPSNFQGTQEAYHGTCYVGILLYEYLFGQDEVIGREFISTKLNEPLMACGEYELSFQISFAEHSTHLINEIQFRLATDNIFYNTVAEVYDGDVFTIPLPVLDTSNWIHVNYKFIASGQEQFLTIGYFSDVDTNELVFNDSTSIYVFDSYGTYIYLDSVSLHFVEELEDCLPQISNVFTPNGDKLNDYFSISGTGISEMYILNRWGNVITELREDNPEWDGTSNGINCTDGSYFYRAKYKDRNITGFIQLIR